ncbi:Retrovirus-related Pol poly from transposon 412, partial, partial [Paramuricea clavata]
MKDALQSSGGIQGVRVVAMQTIHSSSSDQRKIPNINKLNNFQFDGESITAWRSYGIGKGKEVEPVNPLEDSNYNWLESTFTPGRFKRIERKKPGGAATNKPENADEEEPLVQEQEDQINTSSASGFYSCPHDGCVRVFQRLFALEKHLSLE